MNNCCEVPKASPLEESLRNVNGLLCELENVIERLYSRTTPIRLSMPRNPSTASKTVAEPPKAQAVAAIDELGDRLDKYINELRYIIDEFQI
jgi:hypothetical protein